MEAMIQDLRYAFRTLAKSPGFAAVAVLTLALGIGANTAIFGLLYDLVLKPPPYRQPDRLIRLYLTKSGHVEANGNGNIPWSFPKFRTFLQADRTFEGAAAYSAVNLNLSRSGAPERLEAEMVSAEYFHLLGVSAARGRTFLPEDDAGPGRPVVLLSQGFFARRFGSDPHLLGQTIVLNRMPLTVVGILPAGFTGLSEMAEAWVPMALAPRFNGANSLSEAWYHWLDVVARPRPGISVAQALAAMPAAGRAVSAAYPSRLAQGAVWSATAEPLTEARIDPALRRSLLVLMGAVGCVLLIACVNVANLLLARAASRRREVAVRLALGAGRGRLVRQLLTESLLLAGMGGALGLLLSLGMNRLATAFAPAALLGPGSAALAGAGGARALPVVLFALLLSLVTGLLFGAVPAFGASRPDLTRALKEGTTGTARGWASIARLGLRGLLVTGEIALALVLLVAAGLLLQSFGRLSAARAGFNPEHLLTFRLDPPEPAYTRDNAAAFKERLLARITALPGVQSASVDLAPPFSDDGIRTVVTRVDQRAADGPEIRGHLVGPDFFRTLEIPLLAGRSFTPADRKGAPLVALVSQAAARDLWPGQNPLGKRIAAALGMFSGQATAEVVGVAGDVKYDSPERPAGRDLYLSYQQMTPPFGTFFVRTAGDPRALIPAVRREVLALDPDLPVFDLQPMTEHARQATARSRFGALLLSAFAALALLLAGLGIYGVMSYAVAQRTREMGLRMALGARHGDILRLVVGQGALLAAAGIVLGLGAALATTRVLGTLLYGVTPTDPATFAAIALLLGGIGVAAAYLPAQRVRGIDPMVVLKQE